MKNLFVFIDLSLNLSYFVFSVIYHFNSYYRIFNLFLEEIYLVVPERSSLEGVEFQWITLALVAMT